MTTKNWTHFAGAAGWANGADWSPMGAPTTADDAVFDSGTPGTSYAVTGDGTAGSLAVAGDKVTLNGSITITGESGNSITDVRGGGTLTLTATAKLSTSAYVIVGSDVDSTAGTLMVNGTTGSFGAYVGFDGAGTATVSGAGAVFSTADQFYVGSGNSAGTLNVISGGDAYTLGNFFIGSFSAGTGLQSALVTVNGAGSTFSAATLTIGSETSGTLSVQAGASATGTTTTIDSKGSLDIDDLSSFTGAITLVGGLIDAVPEQGGGSAGPGTVTLASAVALGTSGGALESDGPALDLTGLLSGSTGLSINSGEIELSDASNSYSGTITDFGNLVLANATAAGTASIAFVAGIAAQVTAAAGTPTNTITGFAGGDIIDLQGLTFAAGTTTATATASTLVVTDGTTTDTLNVTGLAAGQHFAVARDTAGGTEVIACYCPGTLILTDRGERAVEDLAIGDHVVTAEGASRPVKWIGRRSYAGRFLAGRPHLLPVLIRAGALGGGLPRRDLRVSPQHAMFLDGVLVPAARLVNGSTIVQERARARVDYVHVELPQHEVILAEGAPSESFLDDGSRGVFHNCEEYALLYPDAAAPAGYYARRVEGGFELDAILRRLAGEAKQAA